MQDLEIVSLHDYLLKFVDIFGEATYFIVKKHMRAHVPTVLKSYNHIDNLALLKVYNHEQVLLLLMF